MNAVSALLSKVVIQSEMLSSVLISILFTIFFIYAGNKIKKADPTKRPKGVVLFMEIVVKWLYDYFASIMPKKFAKNYFPYFTMMFMWILLSNISGLFGLEAPTSNYSITLSMTIITFVLIQYNTIKHDGIFSYIKGNLIPPTNLLGLVSPLISLSMRIFCNILSGSFIMAIVYQFTAYISYKVIPFNWLGPILAPLLHCYFDLFSGVIQSLVFVTLSSILISIGNPDEE